MSATLALQKFIVQLLDTSELGVPVYDEVPQNAAFPYVSVGEFTSAQIDDSCTYRDQVSIELHVWSRYEGWKEAKNIQADIDRLLRDQSGEVDGYRITSIIRDTENMFRDPDGVTRHGVSNFIAFVTHLL